ncbi:hypothetical protein [Methylovorus glucosotrophus]|uniref:Uncharacterized protein n=1 Tax=Methylovorus glucosotrophus (strain SIP3-4) TaxID=582744 RepID=C6X7V5_METGS|nr:hypothetical protein [Methylovorus glucosotrophus]ACT51282.1 hypothetical protein Msip34_2040 [Methylovorus glucosotrophus SIP3-4]
MTELNKVSLDKEKELTFIDKIMNDEVFDEKIREELINTKTNEEFVEVLIKHNPTTNFDVFMDDYKRWANNPTSDLRQLTYISKFRNMLGCFIYGTPESQNMPFYFYYSSQDKVRSAPYHFDPNFKQFNKYRLFVNRYTRFFRQRMTNTLSIGLIIFGIVMGFVLKPFIIEVKDQIQIVKDVGKIREDGETRLEEAKARVEKAKSENLEKAKLLKTQYENGELTAEEFNKKALEIKNLDIKYTTLIKKQKIITEADIDISIALRKKKDSDFIESIRKEKEEALKKYETKGE